MAVAALGSAALLAGAYGFQYLGGLPPCAMCWWQRYGHFAAVAFGALGLVAPWGAVALGGAAAAASSSGIGAYHLGVERGWWPGPSTCSGGGDVTGMSSGELLDQIMAAPVVRCDEVLWSFAGLSMAGWNAVLSAGLAVLWLAAARARRA